MEKRGNMLVETCLNAHQQWCDQWLALSRWLEQLVEPDSGGALSLLELVNDQTAGLLATQRTWLQAWASTWTGGGAFQCLLAWHYQLIAQQAKLHNALFEARRHTARSLLYWAKRDEAALQAFDALQQVYQQTLALATPVTTAESEVAPGASPIPQRGKAAKAPRTKAG
ncbi:MAG TPA: hypothetical protein VNJ47_08680 [Nevskiales bacterium]|nr:hypothetical protein [Nevskiales bacterium]